MRIKDIKEILKDLPDDMHIVLSKDKKGELCSLVSEVLIQKFIVHCESKSKIKNGEECLLIFPAN
jgi:hypothetical protein